MRTRVICGLAMALASAALVFATPATALDGNLSINACSDAAANDEWISMGGDLGHWRLYPTCPSAIEVDLVDGGSGIARWQYAPARANVPVTGISVVLSGSNGEDGAKRLGVRVCSDTACGALISPESSNVPRTFAELQDFGLDSPQIPAGAERVELYGECLQTICQDSRRLIVEYISIRYADSNPPASPQITGGTLKPNDWNNGSRTVTYRANDPDSGVSSVASTGHDRFKIFPTGIKIESRQPCYIWTTTAPRFCERDATGTITWDLRLGMLYQGPASLRLSTIDQAGNWSPGLLIPFKIDTVVPPAPNDVRVTNANATGWVNEPTFDLAWTNRSESVETETQSGIGAVAYRVDRPEDPFVSLASPPPVTTEVKTLTDQPLAGEGEWRITMATVDRAGNRSASVSLPVKRDTTELEAPALEAESMVGIADQAAGSALTWRRPGNVGVSGVCGYKLALRDGASSEFGAASEIAGDVEAAALPPGTPDGPYDVNLRGVTCASKPGLAAQKSVFVDLTRPEISIEPHPTWLTAAARLRVVGSDAESGIKSIGLRVDGGPEELSTGNQSEPALPDGTHTVEATAEDAAGNRSAPVTEIVNSDTQAPRAVIETIAQNDPSRVSAAVTDTTSGIESARLEYRAAAGGDWTPLASTGTGDQGSNALRLTGYLPDDKLAPGRYLLRVVGSDVAGNAFCESVRANGDEGSIALPLRALPSITAGIVDPTKRSLVKLRIVKYGARARIEGRFATEGGRPLNGYAIDVLARNWFTSSRVKAATVKTNAAGAFTYVTPPGASREYTLQFRGTKLLRPVAARVDLRVRTGVIFAINRRSVRRGEKVVFSGRIGTRNAVIPAFGKRVDLMYRDGKRWRRFPMKLDRVQKDGRFRLVWRVPSFTATVKMLLRIEAEPEEPWPYEAGASPIVALTIKR